MAFQWERELIANGAISFIILTDGQPEALRKLLADLAREASKRGQPFELLVPLDPAHQLVVEPIIREHSAQSLVDPNVSRGVGAALRLGVEAAKHPLVFSIPVGYEASLLPAFLKEIDLVDIVCGARNGKAKNWKWRQFFSSTYQLFGVWLQDPECPVRLYRRSIFARMPLQSLGAFVFVEILAKANFQGCLISEARIDGPTGEPAAVSGDLRRVMRNPNFGPPPEMAVEPTVKPMLTTQAPASFTQGQD